MWQSVLHKKWNVTCITLLIALFIIILLACALKGTLAAQTYSLTQSLKTLYSKSKTQLQQYIKNNIRYARGYFCLCIQHNSLGSLKRKTILSPSKNSWKMFTADIFIYESLEVSRQSENVGWVYLLNKGQQNTTTNTKHWRSKIVQSGNMWKCSQRRIAPADDKCQNNSDRERKEENTSEQKEQQLFM